MPLVATRGAASAQGFGEFAQSGPRIYIEEVFSTWLYTGNGATQTITNGIDLAGKGGMIWFKGRDQISNHRLVDTANGRTKYLASNTTGAQLTINDAVTAFNNSGFSLGPDTGDGEINGSGLYKMVSWTFRKQPKFFDVVTYTGNGVSGRTVAHDLGSTPGCVIIKSTSSVQNWGVFHRGNGVGNGWSSQSLNSTGLGAQGYPQSTVTSTTVDVTGIVGAAGTPNGFNTNGTTYVMYLFAHNAGGFGLTGTDNVISCGSYVGNGSIDGPAVNLGYEVQWIMTKNVSGGGNWQIQDVMRGMALTSASNLMANLTDAEDTDTSNPRIFPTATGFKVGTANARVNTSGETYIYIAIRRGPMRVPTTGASVFDPEAYSGNGANNRAFTTGFVPDMVWWKSRSNGTDWGDATLLIGTNRGLTLNQTSGEGSAAGYYISTYNNTGFTYGLSDVQYNGSGRTYVFEAFSRAPSFMDVVCYTGTGAAATLNHNLTVSPELVIVKGRSVVSNWETYVSSLGGTAGNALALNDTAGRGGTPPVGSATATTFTLNNGVSTSSGQTYVAYLFASCPGVSKVGSYTGNGSSQTINCGFTGGARFVMVKRTDSTGNWMVVDTARGLVTAGDPTLYLNSTDVEVTGVDWVDPDNSGFIVNQEATMNANVNGGTYIYLAVA